MIRRTNGIPLTGRLSGIHPKLMVMDSVLGITWTPVIKEGLARIWISTTNEFSKGGKDHYELIRTVPVTSGQAAFEMKWKPLGFYKVVVEMGENVLTRWQVVNRSL